MANTFKNNYVDLTTAYADAVASADVTGEGIVLTLRATNIHASNDGTVTVEVVDGTSGASEIAHELSVPNGTTVELAGTSKLVLETGDKVQAKADASSTIELFVSWLHIT
jgi:hypothetical protein|tara:strand:+ start:824 stop:1153 length:330 start_codon:yes stop_codon:yes gene_type:complete